MNISIFLDKEFLSEFETDEKVDTFLRELHTKVYEQMLEVEMDNHFYKRK